MDNLFLIAAASGVAIAVVVVMPWMVRNQRKQLVKLEPMLRERGSMSLDEIATALKTSVFTKGYLMAALDAMVVEGKLTKTAPPKGHPMLRVLRDTKYGLPTSR